MTHKNKRMAHDISFFIMLVMTVMFIWRDSVMPQPYQLIVESDERGMLERPVKLPFYYPNKPYVKKLNLRMKLDHHVFASGKYVVRANCLKSLWVNEMQIYQAPSYAACNASWETAVSLLPHLRIGDNTIRAVVRAVGNEHIHFHMKPCYTFGFC